MPGQARLGISLLECLESGLPPTSTSAAEAVAHRYFDSAAKAVLEPDQSVTPPAADA
jgi:hypothetical protein